MSQLEIGRDVTEYHSVLSATMPPAAAEATRLSLGRRSRQTWNEVAYICLR